MLVVVLCSECLEFEEDICDSCMYKHNICLNCMAYGQPCLNCERDEGVSFDDLPLLV
jgi:hypothetical protein